MKDRMDLYEELELKRNSKVIVYVTGDRPGLETQIANDATDFFVEHLDKIGVVPKISLILYTIGGNTLAAWNIVNLIRMYCDEFEIIVPSKARSAGTLMCLGANRIIMTKQGTLGPIDPSVNTPLNPQLDGAAPGTKVPVSVEAIKGYLELSKNELKITTEGSSTSIFHDLTNNVHPLVLGEVYRAIGQIRMLSEKLLKNQVTDSEKSKKIISFLCSESGSHDYTINRREAAQELGLVVEKPDDELYGIIKKIFNSISNELELLSAFEPNTYLGLNQNKDYHFKRCVIESIEHGTDVFQTEGKFKRVVFPDLTTGIEDQRLFEGWKHV